MTLSRKNLWVGQFDYSGMMFVFDPAIQIPNDEHVVIFSVFQNGARFFDRTKLRALSSAVRDIERKLEAVAAYAVWRSNEGRDFVQQEIDRRQLLIEESMLERHIEQYYEVSYMDMTIDDLDELLEQKWKTCPKDDFSLDGLETPIYEMSVAAINIQRSLDELASADCKSVRNLLVNAAVALRDRNVLGAIGFLDVALKIETKNWRGIFEPAMDGARDAINELRSLVGDPRRCY